MKKMVMFITCLSCSYVIGDETIEGVLPETQNASDLENPSEKRDYIVEPLAPQAHTITDLENPVEKNHYSKTPAKDLTIEIKGGYFFFSDPTMRKVYNEGGEDIQLCLSYPLWKIGNLYGSIEYLKRHGRSLEAHEKTKIEELPLSIGLKPIFSLSSWLDYYLSLGPRYTFVWVKNHSSYVDKNMHKSGFGGFVGTGFIFHLSQYWMLDLFGEYSFTRLHFHSSKHNTISESRQVGGLTFGLGFGYQW